MKQNTILAFIIGLCICFQHSVAQTVSAPANLYAQTSEMADRMIQYDADKRSIMRFYSTASQGDFFSRQQGNSYNSPERRKRLLELVDEYLDTLNKMPFDKWNINGKVDYVLFKRNLESEKYQLQEEQKTYDQVAKYLPFSDRIYALQKPRRRGIAVNGEMVAKELNDINKEITGAFQKLKGSDSIEMKQANLASDAVKGLQSTLKDYYNFYNGYDPLFTWWVPKTYAATDSLLNSFAAAVKKKGKADAFQKDDGSGIIGKPIGKEELVRQLKLEFIAYTPDELVSIANKEFAWCDAEMLKASREMGFGDNWKAALEKSKEFLRATW